jgi:hypothetical protein
MKKYTTPSIEVLDMETEGGILSVSGGESDSYNVNTSVSATSVNEGRRRGDAWTEYDGLE